MTYLALAELMRRPSAFATSVSMILFLVALFCYRAVLVFEGAEIIGNFFFAQFAATAVPYAQSNSPSPVQRFSRCYFLTGLLQRWPARYC
jgi:hypothetical protein